MCNLLLFYYLFPPDHLVDDGDVALYQLDHDIAYVLAYVDVYGGAVVVVAVHRYGGVYRLEQALPVDAGEDEAGIVEAFRALRGGAYADGGERMAYGGEER